MLERIQEETKIMTSFKRVPFLFHTWKAQVLEILEAQSDKSNGKALEGSSEGFVFITKLKFQILSLILSNSDIFSRQQNGSKKIQKDECQQAVEIHVSNIFIFY